MSKSAATKRVLPGHEVYLLYIMHSPEQTTLILADGLTGTFHCRVDGTGLEALLRRPLPVGLTPLPRSPHITPSALTRLAARALAPASWLRKL